MSFGSHKPVEASAARTDHLWSQVSSLPYFRGLLRAVEARFYENIDLPAPTLDLGCGDGHFASLAFSRRLEVGVDPWPGPVREARQRGIYQEIVETDGRSIPYPDAYFASAVSNSVLEHIPDLEPVLVELARVLKPGGLFVFCVPNHAFLPTLSIARFLSRLGLRRLAECYRGFLNRISRHHHCDDLAAWRERLRRTGFEITDQWDYFSPRAQRVLEWGHYFGLPSLITKKLFGRWILAPYRWNLALTMLITRPAYNEPSTQPEGVYAFYICRKSIREP